MKKLVILLVFLSSFSFVWAQERGPNEQEIAKMNFFQNNYYRTMISKKLLDSVLVHLDNSNYFLDSLDEKNGSFLYYIYYSDDKEIKVILFISESANLDLIDSAIVLSPTEFNPLFGLVVKFTEVNISVQHQKKGETKK